MTQWLPSVLAASCAGLLYAPSGINAQRQSETVTFMTEDSVQVFGDLYRGPHGLDAPVILLFHQSGSNSEEYAPIAPKLVAEGFHALAIDARGGGDRGGRANRTVERLPERGGGAEAYFDFKAALAYLRENGFSGPATVWGSSYSAGRMFAVLLEKPVGVVAAIGFSPGAGFVRRGPNGEPSWAEQVDVPVFLTWAASEFDQERRSRFEMVSSPEKTLFIQEHGVHGSSTLHPDRNPEESDRTWNAVVRFLNQYARP